MGEAKRRKLASDCLAWASALDKAEGYQEYWALLKRHFAVMANSDIGHGWMRAEMRSGVSLKSRSGSPGRICPMWSLLPADILFNAERCAARGRALNLYRAFWCQARRAPWL